MGIGIYWVDSKGVHRLLSDLFMQDERSGHLSVTSHIHHNIHDKKTCTILDVANLAINNIRDLQLYIPDGSPVRAHFTFQLDAENETEWYLYRDVNVVLAGTDQGKRNSDHDVSEEGQLSVKYIDNSNLADANVDTDVTVGSEVYHGIIGSGREAGNHNHDNEIILSKGVYYCLRIIASVAGYTNYHLDWYEDK